ncbi:hypothetical protein GJAV_G00185080 [Gymnothorax javanicus]|nr:hypothetical protein GJAV_G00185080 [Gymnothorax javanicus]
MFGREACLFTEENEGPPSAPVSLSDEAQAPGEAVTPATPAASTATTATTSQVPATSEEEEEAPPPEKKRKLVTDLTDDEEQSKVEWLRKYPVIYNKKMKGYKESQKKDFDRQERWIQTELDFLKCFIIEVQKKTAVSIKERVAQTVAQTVHENNSLPPDDASKSGAVVVAESHPQPSQDTSTHHTSGPVSRQSSAASRTRARQSKKLADLQSSRGTLMEMQRDQVESLRQPPKPKETMKRVAYFEYIKLSLADLDEHLWR